MSALIAVVPARGGSKGLPGKNLLPLGGVPLWRRAVDQGLGAGAERVLVTTDIPEILNGPAVSGVEIVERPAHLAGDATPMAPVLLHALGESAPQGSTVILLQPTSPLRSVDDIAEAVDIFRDDQHDLVMSVTEADRAVLKYGTVSDGRFTAMREQSHCFSNRQSLPPVVRPTGAVYVFGRDWFIENGGFVSERIGVVHIPSERSLDIDTAEDLARAEALLTGD